MFKNVNARIFRPSQDPQSSDHLRFVPQREASMRPLFSPESKHGGEGLMKGLPAEYMIGGLGIIPSLV